MLHPCPGMCSGNGLHGTVETVAQYSGWSAGKLYSVVSVPLFSQNCRLRAAAGVLQYTAGFAPGWRQTDPDSSAPVPSRSSGQDSERIGHFDLCSSCGPGNLAQYRRFRRNLAHSAYHCMEHESSAKKKPLQTTENRGTIKKIFL